MNNIVSKFTDYLGNNFRIENNTNNKYLVREEFCSDIKVRKEFDFLTDAEEFCKRLQRGMNNATETKNRIK